MKRIIISTVEKLIEKMSPTTAQWCFRWNVTWWWRQKNRVNRRVCVSCWSESRKFLSIKNNFSLYFIHFRPSSKNFVKCDWHKFTIGDRKKMRKFSSYPTRNWKFSITSSTQSAFFLSFFFSFFWVFCMFVV